MKRGGGVARDGVLRANRAALLDDLARGMEALDRREAGTLEPGAHRAHVFIEGGHRRAS
jgi:hypothetical protein